MLSTTSALIILGYLVFALTRFSMDENDIKCKELIIDINGKIELIQEQEVSDMLRDKGLHPIGKSLNRLQTERIELFLMQNPFIRKAICHHTPDARVFVKITLREPKFLVLTNETYYVGQEKEILPVPLHEAAYVPVVTGQVSQSMATQALFDFIDYIEKNTFWNAQTAQIHVRNDLKIELVPRVGNTTILLGNIEKYQEKLDKVYRIYTQGFKKIGWNRYQKLDVQYEGQVIGIKNEETLMDF